MEEETKDKNINPVSDLLCFHCGSYSENYINHRINGVSRKFCCNGCKTACELIYSVGAESYYDKREGFSKSPVKAKENLFPYDSNAFKDKYLDTTGNNSTISLGVENLHCPSCIWVIEKVLQENEFVESVVVNYGSKKAKVTWNNSFLHLESIIKVLEKLGYPATPIEKNSNDSLVQKDLQNLLIRLGVTGFGTVSTMFLSEPFYFDEIQDLDPQSILGLHVFLLLISTPIFFYSIKPFFRKAYSALKFKVATMDLSVFLGASLIYIYSLYGVFSNTKVVYFDCLNMFLFFILLGRFIETSIQHKVIVKASEGIKNYSEHARIIDENKEEKIIDSSELKKDDFVSVKKGEIIPSDGIIAWGETTSNEAIITGESTPVSKKQGDNILGGTLNLKNDIVYRVTAIKNESTIGKISQVIDDISLKKSYIQSLADKYSSIFIFFVLIVALATYLFFLPTSNETAILRAITVIILACPCALGLAVPMSVSISAYNSIKKGILFKNTQSFEILSKINHFVFDKTGTLTLGKLEVSEIKAFGDISEEKILEIASAIERYSYHPVAWTIVAEATNKNITTRKANNFEELQGKGVSGDLDGKKYFLGNSSFIIEKNNSISLENKIIENKLQVFIADEKQLLGYITFSETLRNNVQETIKELQKRKIDVSILSGDKENITQKTAMNLEIKQFKGQVLPEEKAEYIKELKTHNKMVAMTGDGVNDTPAMVSADLGIGFCSNNKMISSNTDIIILNDDFSTVLKAVEISKKTYSFIRQNLTISLIYNISVIPAGILGYISPLWASLLMPLSSIIVIANSSRLYYGDDK